MPVLYPVAETAEAALSAPLGRAAREREARARARQDVRFVTEDVGPAFTTREAGLQAYGRYLGAGPEGGWCVLVERLAPHRGRAPVVAPVKPAFRDGRRWPETSPQQRLATLWRLSVTYWKIVTHDAGESAPGAQARAARQNPAFEGLDPCQLRALARQPLQPVRPQQPLNFGLFEAPAPENPDLLLPDE